MQLASDLEEKLKGRGFWNRGLYNQIMLAETAHLITWGQARSPPLFTFGFLDVISSGTFHFSFQKQNNKRRWRKASHDLTSLRGHFGFSQDQIFLKKPKKQIFHLLPGLLIGE